MVMKGLVTLQYSSTVCLPIWLCLSLFLYLSLSLFVSVSLSLSWPSLHISPSLALLSPSLAVITVIPLKGLLFVAAGAYKELFKLWSVCSLCSCVHSFIVCVCVYVLECNPFVNNL